MALLPSLDQSALHRKIRSNSSGTDIWVKVFTCPDDFVNVNFSRQCSMVVNHGYYDWAPNTSTGVPTQRQRRASGVFFFRNQGGSLTLDDVNTGDGTGQTIFVSEHTRVGNWFVQPTDPTTGAFVAGNAVDWEVFGARVSLMTGIPGSAATNPQNSIGIAGHVSDPGLNGPNTSGRGPSSNHQVVHIGMGDGSVRKMNEAIDWRVYLRLLSSDGQRVGDQGVVGDDQF